MSETAEIFGGPSGQRSWLRAMARGLAKKCPQCGRGALFSGYVKIRDNCPACGLDLTGHEADDAPPYVTIMVVGHIAIPLALAAKQLFDPPMWQQFAFWMPAIIAATALGLPVFKGALIGIQWANRMHGFAAVSDEPKTGDLPPSADLT